ncbi:patatin-like phospholipase family protein [Aspergillus undulatus]|uniref:patatin-like phospholipase family protein n=1 Tax=Aspergillus undulatus TaxID=1810928 RepID=UPI003CCCD10B
MRLIREQRQVLFSATHLNAFFELSLQHFCAEPFVPFNYITAARKWYPLDGAFTSHLISFLEAGKRVPYDEVASYIASTILMDAYPIHMHHFCPLEVFKTLYRDACNRALQHCYSTDAIVRIQCNKIEARLSDFFHEMATNSTPTWEIHRRNLSSQKKFWTHARSNMTCLICLRRHPEHVPTCGHAICDTCTEVFGEPAPHAYDKYIVRECIVCGALANLTVKMKPRTAGPRVLTIDGGGSLVVTSLENLEILQEILGPDLPVGDFFELDVGSSSGGLVVLSMATRALDIAQCKSLFQTLAKRVFSFRRKWIGSWLHDEKYHGSALDDVLMEHYTPTQRLYGTPASMISSSKVAVTVTSLDGDSFGNPFQTMVDTHASSARATAAAPSLFSTVSLPGLGSFQDGGIPRYNNPASVAELEVKHLWPGATPDVFITLGTGTGLRSTKPSSFRNVLIDGWIPRVYRAMQRTFDGRVPWLEQYSRLNDNAKENYFRFDPCFHQMPPMDDTKCMEYLSKQTRIQSSWQNSSEAAVALLVSSLFFQLDAMPEYQSGFFHCRGTIRSRCPPEPLIRRLSQLEPGRQDFFKDQINLGLYLSSADICSSCHRYSLAARFYVRNLDESITLSLRLGSTKRRLSAFPKSMQRFIEEQGLDSPFGHSNHDIPLLVNCSACMTRTGTQRRKRKFIEL